MRSETIHPCFIGMSGGSAIPTATVKFRTAPLDKHNRITPVPTKLVEHINQSRDKDDNDSFDPDKLHLAAITTLASGECMFASLSMALYGIETQHFHVRTRVCDFIQYHIIPNYATLDFLNKLNLMINFNLFEEFPVPDLVFHKHAMEYIDNMREKSTFLACCLNFSTTCEKS